MIMGIVNGVMASVKQGIIDRILIAQILILSFRKNGNGANE